MYDREKRRNADSMDDDVFHDSQYLAKHQYRDAGHLSARQRLHARFCSNSQPWYRWVFGHLVHFQRANVLEVGAGFGQLWHENLERIPSGWRVALTDLSPGMLCDARSRLAPCGFRPELLAADVTALPFEDGQFDFVLANHMLYHVPDLDAGLSEIRRVMRPGGTVFAATNGANHMRELIEWGRKLGAARWVGFRESELSFSIENGESQLSKWFGDVRFERYEDHLLVTEVEPLVEYVLSMLADPAESEREARLWRGFLGEVLAKHGVILITKDTGLFTAVRK